MHAQLLELEAEWLRALQDEDSETLEELLDPAFVCAPWSPEGNLLLKEQYLREVKHARFNGCGLNPVYVQEIGRFAIVRCRVSCEYTSGDRKWIVDMLLTDVWVNREGRWRALNRDLTPASRRRSLPLQNTLTNEPGQEMWR